MSDTPDKLPELTAADYRLLINTHAAEKATEKSRLELQVLELTLRLENAKKDRQELTAERDQLRAALVELQKDTTPDTGQDPEDVIIDADTTDTPAPGKPGPGKR